MDLPEAAIIYASMKCQDADFHSSLKNLESISYLILINTFRGVNSKQKSIRISLIFMIRILLIRHALTDIAGRRLSGRKPGVKLNEVGRNQAIELADRLSKRNVSAIFSSPLERAVETANPLAKTLGLTVNISDDFTEVDFGDWTDLAIEELRADPLFRSFNSFRSGTRVPGGEMMTEVQMRFVKGILKLHSGFRDENIAIFSHADPVRSALAFFAGIPLDMAWRIEISPASVSVLEIYDDGARILLINETVLPRQVN